MVPKRFQVKNTEMKITTVNKFQFASLNDKQYHLPDGITLPFGLLLLLELRDKKKKLFQKYKKQLKKKKQFIKLRK